MAAGQSFSCIYGHPHLSHYLLLGQRQQNKRHLPESSPNLHPSVEKLSSTKPVPGTKKAGAAGLDRAPRAG